MLTQKERSRRYYQKNKKRLLQKNKEKYRNNKKYFLEYVKKWRLEHKEYCKKYQKSWAKKYFAKNKVKLREYYKKRRQETKKDPKLRLDYNLSAILRRVLGKKKGGRSLKELIGYTLQDLIQHIEKQFDEKMNWENYGSYWHLDHKIPKSWFKYETAEDEEFKRCWGLTNLQPLEGGKNYSKGNRFIS